MNTNSYHFENDIRFICDVSGLNLNELSKATSVSKRTILYAYSGDPSDNTLEKVYTYIYQQGYRLSIAKSEIFKESLSAKEQLFFHGSKYGISNIRFDGSKFDSDFSYGFYCSKRLESASSFTADYKASSVYVFKANLSGLKIVTMNCDLDWMLAISYYRRKISEYSSHPYIQNLIRRLETSDIIIAPIADNKMFEVLNQFAVGEITSDQALHSLSASRLGDQYVFKTEKAINRLQFLDRFYLCNEERANAKISARENENVIQTKLSIAKREFRNQGKYIDELFV